MQMRFMKAKLPSFLKLGAFVVLALLATLFLPKVWANQASSSPDTVVLDFENSGDAGLSKPEILPQERLITIYDQGQKRVVMSDRTTVAEVLEQAKITLQAHDISEPELEAEISSDDFNINIFRAKPVLLVDGDHSLATLSPYQTAEQIARSAGLEIFPEDIVEAELDFLATGVQTGVKYVVKRAKLLNFIYYGKNTELRSQAKTVAEFLAEKNINLTADDHLNLPLEARLENGSSLELWREGLQETVVEEDVSFSVRKVYDVNRDASYRVVEQAGKNGRRVVTYEVNIKNGAELNRREISSLVTLEPVEQVEVVGVVRGERLTASRGVYNFVDSNGIVHRETYYDLPMRIVMRNCGAGGYYTVREDGVKVDRDGYVIIAAHLGNYPRCSVVETSLGPAKVYDTGTFTQRHPHGFDIATDWTKRDGI